MPFSFRLLYPPIALYLPFRESVNPLNSSFYWQPSRLPPFSYFNLTSPPPTVPMDNADSDSDNAFLERD